MFGLVSPVNAAAGIQDWDKKCLINGVATIKCFESVFSNLIYMASALIIFLLFIMIVVGAFQYLTSFGDPGKVKKAQSTLRFSIFGFVLFLASFLILQIIDTLFLGGQGALFQFNLEQ